MLELINKKINSQAFIKQYKLSPKFFLRNRILTFPRLILFQLCLLRASYQTELENFFKRLAADGSKQLNASDTAYCRARKKFSAGAFVELNELCMSEFYKTKMPRTWHGFHLFAIDGSTAHLNGVDSKCRHYLDPEAES